MSRRVITTETICISFSSSILLSVENCRRCWCRRYIVDDAANVFRSTRDRVAIAKLHSLLRQRESSGFSYTFTHLWNIDFPRRTTPCRGGNYSYIRRLWDMPEGCPCQSHARLPHCCHVNRSTRTTSKKQKERIESKLSLVVGQIFNFCYKTMRAKQKFARRWRVKLRGPSLRRPSFPDVKRLRRILTSERRATRDVPVIKK